VCKEKTIPKGGAQNEESDGRPTPWGKEFRESCRVEGDVLLASDSPRCKVFSPPAWGVNGADWVGVAGGVLLLKKGGVICEGKSQVLHLFQIWRSCKAEPQEDDS